MSTRHRKLAPPFVLTIALLPGCTPKEPPPEQISANPPAFIGDAQPETPPAAASSAVEPPGTPPTASSQPRGLNLPPSGPENIGRNPPGHPPGHPPGPARPKPGAK